MVEHELVFRLADFAACLLSLCSCCVLVCRLRSLPTELRGRLFPRQALWLGFADVAYTVAKLTIHHLRFVIGTDFLDLCHHAWFIMITTNVTYLMEMFLCLGFAFQAAKSSRGLRLLRYSGVLSLVIGGLVVLTEPFWNLVGLPDLLMCQVVDTHTMDIAFIVLTIACLLVSFCSFVFVLAAPHPSSNAVHRRVVVRSTAYMVKTVTMVFPTLLALVLFKTIGLRPAVLVFAQVANILQDFNGVANALTYYFLSRYSRRRMVDTPPHLSVAEESYHVAFDAGVGVRMFDRQSTSPSMASSLNREGDDSSYSAY